MRNIGKKSGAIIFSLLMIISAAGGGVVLGSTTATMASADDLDSRTEQTRITGTTGTVNAAVQVDVDPSDLAGSGRQDDPYIITNASELQAIEDDLDAAYELGANIEAGTTASWNNGNGFNPIGNDSSVFTGTLNGQGYHIADLVIDRPESNLTGLFAIAGGDARLRQVALENVSVTGAEEVGGIAGRNSGTVNRSYITGSVTGADFVGGISGSNLGTVHSSYSTGSVNGSTEVGGIVGSNLESGRVHLSNSTGSINGSSDVGGVVGLSYGTVTRSYSSGSVTGSEAVGGVIGSNVAVRFGETDAVGIVESSYATGSVSGSDFVGGIVGSNGGTVNRSYAAGPVSGTNDAGGIIGANNGGNVTDSYWDTQQTGQSTTDGSGTGLATANMTGQSAIQNMSEFDFNTTWKTTESYPELRAFSDTSGQEGDDGSGGENNRSLQVDVDPDDLPGNGTESDPYQISNASELQAIEDDLDANYTLVTNINASNTAQWNNGKGFDPVGSVSSNESTSPPFNGSLDGNNHTIRNITINRPDEEIIGLVGVMRKNSIIQNISVHGEVTGLYQVGSLVGGAADDSTIRGTKASVSVHGNQYTGGLVGIMLDNTTVQNATASGPVNGSDDTGGLTGFSGDNTTIQNATASGNVDGSVRVGGLIGQTRGTVKNVTASGAVSGSFQVGGLAGRTDNSSRIRNATASGDVSGQNRLIGGLVGSAAANSTVQNAQASGVVNGSEDAGGLIGFSGDNTTIQDATASGNVTGSVRVGGLAGQVRGTLRTATASGTVTGSTQVGGLAGVNEGGTIRNATASGSVNGNELVGGLAGVNEGGTIRNATASGSVNGNELVGGLVGSIYQEGNIKDVRASGDVVGTSYLGGLVGSNNDDDDGIIQDAVASGDVTGIYSVGGLVGVSRGSIINVTASGSVAGDERVGGLVGIVTGGTLSNTRASGDVDGSRDVGGLVGTQYAEGKIKDARASGDVIGDTELGGLAGSSEGTIQNARASGDVIGNGSVRVPDYKTDHVGGLVGVQSEGTIKNAIASGNVTGAELVGGLAGANFENGTITNATASGDVNGSSEVGGLVGLNKAPRSGNATVTNATASGDVNGNSSVGGLVGSNDVGIIQDAAASGGVNGNSSVGGLVGSTNTSFPPKEGKIQDVFAIGRVTGTDSVGGLVGSVEENSTTITSAYWDEQATGQSTSGGSARSLTTAEMTGEAARTNMSGLDFNNTWETTSSYPELRERPEIDGEPTNTGPTVDTDASFIEPGTATVEGTQEYSVSIEINNISDSTAGGEVGVEFEGFTNASDPDGPDANELTINYTAANVTGGTLEVSANVSTTAPNATGPYDVAVTDLRQDNRTETAFLIEDASISFDTIDVSDDDDESDPSGPEDGDDSGGSGTRSAIVAYKQTTSLETGQLDPDSLSGKIRAETGNAENVSVDLLRSSQQNYSIAITGPEGAENVTFYLQARAISSSQNIEEGNLNVFVNGSRQTFNITSQSNSPWVGFVIPHFSTQVVTFTSGTELSNASVSDTVIQSGESVTVNATLENTGSESATVMLNLTDNGTQIDNKTVTVASGEKRAVNFTPTLNEVRDHELNISGLSAGTVEVTESESDPITSDPTETETSSEAPGFGPVVTLAALLSMMLLALRRRST